MVDDRLEDLVAKAIEMALAGDPQTLAFLLGRRIPAPKPTDHTVQFPLPDDIKPGDLDGITLAVLKAVAESRLDPTSGAKLCSALTAHTHMVSTKEMQSLGERLADIERMMQGKPTLNAEPSSGPRIIIDNTVGGMSMEAGDQQPPDQDPAA
jgi:hypothetical protein